MYLQQHEGNLQNESTKHVPKKMGEQEFWRRYFATVKQGKHVILEKDRKQDIYVVPLTLDEGSCTNAAVENLEMEVTFVYYYSFLFKEKVLHH